MLSKIRFIHIGVTLVFLVFAACVPVVVKRTSNSSVPARYHTTQDTVNSVKVRWNTFFTDPRLVALIEEALKNNQELHVILQEIQIARNEVRTRKGEYLPFAGLRGAAGVDKAARYTHIGASEATTEIKTGTRTPEPLPDYLFGAFAAWEVDIWNKLHNAKKAAVSRYMATTEGKNFMVTNLVAEIANTYYELIALDNQLELIKQNIAIQTDALGIVKLQKESARVTELAVRRFEAQVFSTRSLQYNIQQRIFETENRINFLLGRFPQPVLRNSQQYDDLVPVRMYTGIPSQLLANRPDIRQAELELMAAKLDLKSARANFYPS